MFIGQKFSILWANSSAVTFWNATSAESLYARNLITDMSVSVRSRLTQILEDCKTTNSQIAEHWTLYPKGVPVTSELIFNEIQFSENHSALLIHALNEGSTPTSYTLHSAQALMHTSAMISLYNSDYELVYSNPAARKIADEASQSLASKFVDDAELAYLKKKLELHGRCSIEAEVNTNAGKVWHSMDVEVSPDARTGQCSILISASDVTERRRAQLEAYLLAYTDSLTGLPNRAALIEGIGRSIEECEVGIDNLAIVFLDLNRFKLINDSLGHRVGDGLLVETASRLKTVVAEQGIVGRLGGDEFVILLNTFSSRDHLAALIETISSRISDPMIVEGHHLQADSSIGICCYPEHGQDTTELLKNADVAMYTSKYQNLNFTFFDASMEEGIRNRLVLEQDLAQAIKNDDFVVTQSVYDTLDELTRMGVRLAIDDFGTGYSNLAYLQKYPLHSLKIDRVFLVEKDRRSVLEMIIKIGKVLGLCVVAEGVETLEEVEWLTAHGCDELQGYFFSYPLPVEEMTRYLQQYQPVLPGSTRAEQVA